MNNKIYCHICNEYTNIDIPEVSYSNFSRHHLKKKHDITLKEYYDKYLKKENEDVCIECGKNTKFKTFKDGYLNKCSYCLQYGQDTRNKIKNTNLKKYGSEHNWNKDSNVRYKCNETNLKKYGVDNIFKDKEYIRKKTFDKYGVENAMQSKDVIDKVKKRNVEKRINKLKNYNSDLVEYSENVTFFCDKCDSMNKTSKTTLNKRIREDKDVCINCNPFNTSISSYEIEILEFIRENYKGDISQSDRTILKGKELDIYIPELKLAFEFNGLYWHNENHVNSDYHMSKTDNCLDSNIHLIHIYEDQWKFKKDIVKSRILNLFGCVQRIYARKTNIKEVSSKESKHFLEENHIQGNVNGKIRLGLFDGDDMVSLMTFGSLRKNLGSESKDGHYELLRFCNKINTTVIGGASKLFKFFKRTYEPLKIVSYADRSWSQGQLYEKLEFNYVSTTKPNYHYVVNGIRENRFKYRKSELIKQGFDGKLTEREIMMSRKIYRIYDSGNLKYVFEN